MRLFAFGLWLVASCGGGGEAAPGDVAGDPGPSWAPCEDRPDPGAVTHVDLLVDSPVPPALSTSCAQGSVADLTAYLSIVDVSCPLDVAAAGVTGCCAKVPADQNADVYLYFRSVSRNLPVGVQVKRVELPTSSPPVMDLTFAGVSVDDDWDTDGDSTGNLVEWCAGTL